ncbi:MAG: DNA gyrase inhibitor YacG [Gammaproteobacteria bacterium]|nr:DNA gyrase inhibitor YacG [Gammaproteobacteria bacterium]
MNVDCPTCGALVKWSEKATFRPFCSERCRLIDLGAWADEQYAIPTQDHPSESELSSGE